MPSFKIIGLLASKQKVLKVFTIHRHGGHLDHVTWTIYTNFGSPFPRRIHLIGQALSEKMFKNNGHVHVYSPMEGVDNPLGQSLFKNRNFL